MRQYSMDEQQQKDQNVYSFMLQLVQEKRGDDLPLQQLNTEADTLYEIFGDNLVTYFEPQLNEQQQEQFSQMVDGGAEDNDLMDYLLENISNLEEQIVAILVQFRQDYLSGKFEQTGGADESTESTTAA
ncbi:MAG: hypothetical protein ACOCXP_01570 [Candidatus Dojkabacteria bacterium]